MFPKEKTINCLKNFNRRILGILMLAVPSFLFSFYFFGMRTTLEIFGIIIIFCAVVFWIAVAICMITEALTFMTNLFSHIEATSSLNKEIDKLRYDNAALQDDLNYEGEISNNLRADYEIIKKELSAAKLQLNPINWEELCKKYPNTKYKIVHEIQDSHALGMKEAQNLVDLNVTKVANIGKGFKEVDTTNNDSWFFMPVSQPKSREIKLDATATAATN